MSEREVFGVIRYCGDEIGRLVSSPGNTAELLWSEDAPLVMGVSEAMQFRAVLTRYINQATPNPEGEGE